ncbi:MAG: FHA domain-containing protein [Deltaproteobacteria bacterium]|nr:FHA domain-containing protein [Deltaproteobacteria bacterium]
MKTFSLGSSQDRDLVIPGEFLSALHCVLERRGPGLRVHDQGSRNGTFFGDRRETVFDLRPGETFTAASIRFLAMNDEMRAAYPTLVDILGGEDEHSLRSAGDVPTSPSDLIVAATLGGNLLITGEPGCEQDRLAHTIHAISLRRTRPIVELGQVPDDRTQQRAIIDRAARSTLLLAIEPKSQVIETTFCSMIFSSSFQIRVLALAPSIAKASDVLGDATVRPMQHVWLRPLAQRPGAIHLLLDHAFAERGAPLRVSDLSDVNREALHAYSWPDNFTGLRVAADRLVVLARAGSLRRAAEALHIGVSTLHYWLNQVGLTLPLVVAG